MRVNRLAFSRVTALGKVAGSALCARVGPLQLAPPTARQVLFVRAPRPAKCRLDPASKSRLSLRAIAANAIGGRPRSLAQPRAAAFPYSHTRKSALPAGFRIPTSGRPMCLLPRTEAFATDRPYPARTMPLWPRIWLGQDSETGPTRGWRPEDSTPCPLPKGYLT